MPSQTRARPALVSLVLLGAVSFLVPAVFAQSADNVAVVINDDSAASREIGEYYIRMRGIAPTHVIRLRTSIEEVVARGEFVTTIQGPIAAALARGTLQDRVLYLVLTKGVPLRVAGTGGADGTVASVDSELTLLYRRMLGQPVATRGHLDNPYFLADRPVAAAQRFSRRAHDIYLVSRLDAFTVADARGLIDRGLKPTTHGQVVLDQRDALTSRAAEDWLSAAAERLIAAGHGDRVVLETTVQPAREAGPVLGFFSWGSTDPQHRRRASGLTFAPGALASSFVSTDARTLSEPAAEWRPTNDPNDRASWFEGSPQSLIGDLIRDGVTGAAGHVSEPFLESVIRPQVLFGAYLEGFNLVESFYLAMPHLSWQTVVVGDPLVQPFMRRALPPEDLSQALDDTAGLPAAFFARRLAVASAQAPSASPRALALALRSEARLALGDSAGARQALEASTDVDATVVPVQFQLAALYERDGQYERAIERYRRILRLQPNHATTLNNLAFLLATQAGAAAEALPLAARAAALAPDDAAVTDTLGWVHHLLGHTAIAEQTLAEAVRRAPRDAQIRLHAAIVYDAAGNRSAAAIELAQAIRLDPAIAKRDDAGGLRDRLDAKRAR